MSIGPINKLAHSLRMRQDSRIKQKHKQRENETSKLATPFSEGAEAETQTAGTPTGKGTT